LHGGPNGFNRRYWHVADQTATTVRLELDWEDPAGGFPGPIHAEILYGVEGATLTYAVTATCPQTMVCDIVSHPYFNLAGRLTPIAGHTLQIPASAYLPIDENLIPLPEAPAPVAGTPFDLREARPVGEVVGADDPQVHLVGGMDHAFVLDDGATGDGLRLAATLTDPDSGRRLDIESDHPALQVYTGQYLADTRIAHPASAGGSPAGCAIALETEDYPDAPRRPDFPSILVRPGETWCRTTRWVFSTM